MFPWIARGRISSGMRPAVMQAMPTDRPGSGAGDDSTGLEIAADVQAAQAGDGEAFARLVRRHAARVIRLVGRFARSPADLDEIAQDVFVEAHRSLSRYRGEAPLEHWLSRIATRRCY